MPHVTVSVIIPTYNRNHLVCRAILSAALQTTPPSEIIVIDDCSTDDTAQRVNQLIGCRGVVYPTEINVVLHRQPRNAGANAARNAGVRLATSRYVAFLDSDDLWHPQKMQEQMGRVGRALLEAWQPIFSFTGRFRVDDKLRILDRQYPANNPDQSQLLKLNAIGTLSSVVIDRCMLLSSGLFDESLRACQDWDMYLRTVPLSLVVGISYPYVMYFDGKIDRITRAPNSRLRAHLAIYRKYSKGTIKAKEKVSFYRNIAEDLAQVGRHRLSKKFRRAYFTVRFRSFLIGWFFAELNSDLVDSRYRSYARSLRRMNRNAELKAENVDIENQYKMFLKLINDNIMAIFGEVDWSENRAAPRELDN